MDQKFSNNLIIVFFLLVSISVELTAQIGSLETIRQSDSEIFWLDHTNGYTYWAEYQGTNFELIFFREFEGTIESRKLPEAYEGCNIFNGMHAYSDFLFLKVEGDSGFCTQDFVWEGDNELIEDPYNILSVCAKYENLFLSERGMLFDVNTKTSQSLNLENDQYRYRSSNICSINDQIINIRADKIEKATGLFITAAIIQYDWQDDVLKEVFVSDNFLSFGSQQSDNGRLVFKENPPASLPIDSMKIYYYDGVTVHLIAQRFVPNDYAVPYLNGVAYSSGGDLFYWEDGYTSLLSESGSRLTLDGCKLAWFSAAGTNAQLDVYNGNTYTSIPFSGFPESTSLKLIPESSFVFSMGTLTGEFQVLKGVHGLTCTNSCADADLQIPEDDNRSYLNARSITSEAIINTGNTIYKAQESVRLIPGFLVENGAEFVAKVAPCENGFLGNNENDFERTTALVEENLDEKIAVNQSARIEQNVPNPHNGSSSIKYFMPTNDQNAKIKIFNAVGLLVKEIVIDDFGEGKVDVQLNGFTSGVYHYALEVNGEVIEVKKMILIK